MGTQEPPEVVSAGSLSLCRRPQRAELDGRELKVTAKEFALLWLLVRNRGLVLRRDMIEKEVWGGSVKSRTLDTHIGHLRRLLPPEAIHTVIKVGYRLDL